MIVLEHVTKRYRTGTGTAENAAHLVLDDVSLRIERHMKLALIGSNGAGKSTLLNVIAGMDRPTRGTVHRHCKVSWPLGLSGGFQGSLSGAQNARFIARIHAIPERALCETLTRIRAFSELGPAFEQPVKTYSSGMRSRLAFAISLAFDFDVYLVDELISVGDAAFRKKSRAAFSDLAARSGLIMVSHDDNVLRQFCDAAVWLRDGKTYWFDSVDTALARYHESLT